MKARLIKVEAQESIIYVICRLENGKKKILRVSDFEPYFFVQETVDVPPIKSIKRVEMGDYISIEGIHLKKIYTTFPYNVPLVREQFSKTWEGDVVYTRRFMVDRNIKDFFMINDDINVDNDYTFVNISKDDIHGIDFDDIMWDIEESIMYIDCETYGFVSPENPENKVLTITTFYNDKLISFMLDKFGRNYEYETVWVDNLNKMEYPWVLKYYSDELEMFKELSQYIKIKFPDIISGYNIFGFDLPVIINRISNLGGNTKLFSLLNYMDRNNDSIPGCIIGDIQPIWAYMNNLPTIFNPLKDVALKVCDFKIPKEVRDEIPKLWDNGDVEKIAHYNCYDVVSLKLIDKKDGVNEYMRDFMRFVGIRETDINSAVRIHRQNAYYIRDDHNIIPSVQKYTDITRIKGAYVFDPDPGLYKNVCVLDLSRIYPSIILHCNLSYDTYSKHDGIKMPSGHSFIQEKEGMMAKIVKYMFGMRDKYDDKIKKANTRELKDKLLRKRQPIKDIINSIYGVSLYHGYPLFRKEVAETVTYIARDLITIARDTVEKNGFKVIYGDTDGIHIHLNTDDKYKAVINGYILEGLVNDSLKKYAENIGISNTDAFKIEFETLFETLLMSDAKKRYSGKINWEDGNFLSEDMIHIKTRGYELRRSSEPMITRDVQGVVFNMLMENVDRKIIYDFVRTNYDLVRKGILPLSYISPSPQFKKSLGEYKVESIHIKAIKFAKKYINLNFSPGERVHYVYLVGRHYNTDDDNNREYGSIGVDTGLRVKKSDKVNVMGFKTDEDIPQWMKNDVDYKMMADKFILEKVGKIFRPIGWDDYHGYIKGIIKV